MDLDSLKGVYLRDHGLGSVHIPARRVGGEVQVVPLPHAQALCHPTKPHKSTVLRGEWTSKKKVRQGDVRASSRWVKVRWVNGNRIGGMASSWGWLAPVID